MRRVPTGRRRSRELGSFDGRADLGQGCSKGPRVLGIIVTIFILLIATDDVDSLAVHRHGQRRTDGVRQPRAVRFFVLFLSDPLVAAASCAFMSYLVE